MRGAAAKTPLRDNATGGQNTAIGFNALTHNTGANNTALGYSAGVDLTTGAGNVCIGSAVPGVAGESNTTRIGNIGFTPQGGGLTVTVESVGGDKLGYIPSSRRYKQDIKPIERASEALLALKPVSFRYKKKIDPAQLLAFGLIAEEVEKVNPDLVARNREGQAESVRYEYINVMLLNEFIKEHGKLEEQQATIADLKSTIAQQQKSFQSRLSEQEKQIADLALGLEKVSAQLESTRLDRQVVVNNP